MKKVTIVHAQDKSQGMSVPEIVSAMKGLSQNVTISASVTWKGRIKNLTVTENTETRA